MFSFNAPILLLRILLKRLFSFRVFCQAAYLHSKHSPNTPNKLMICETNLHFNIVLRVERDSIIKNKWGLYLGLERTIYKIYCIYTKFLFCLLGEGAKPKKVMKNCTASTNVGPKSKLFENLTFVLSPICYRMVEKPPHAADPLKGPKHDQVGYEFFLHKADPYG
jgi:hypothetical protein